MLEQRISNLKTMVNNYNLDEATCEFIHICNTYEVLEDISYRYVDDKMINDIIKGYDDWVKIANFLANVNYFNYLNNDFYHIDRDGNLEELKSDILLSDINTLEEELSEILDIETKAYDTFIDLKEFTNDFQEYNSENLEYNFIEFINEYVITYNDYVLIHSLDDNEAALILEKIHELIENEVIESFRVQELGNNDDTDIKDNKDIASIINDIITCDNDLEYDAFKDLFIGECECYDTLENIINGIDTGAFDPEHDYVNGLVCHEQTSNIFKNYFDEILDIANNYQQKTGETLDLDANTLVWFAWNETVIKWYNEIQDYLEKIII